MATSRRPIVDALGTTWLGDPEGGSHSIEIADDFIGVYEENDETRVAWSDIASLVIDIPTAPWRLAVASQWAVSTMDVLEAATSTGVTTTSPGGGHKDITVRITRRDGSEVTGSASKHQTLGYPKAETQAAIAVLQGRVGRSAV